MSQFAHPVRIGDVLLLPVGALNARTSTWLKLVDWALGRNRTPLTDQEDCVVHRESLCCPLVLSQRGEARRADEKLFYQCMPQAGGARRSTTRSAFESPLSSTNHLLIRLCPHRFILFVLPRSIPPSSGNSSANAYPSFYSRFGSPLLFESARTVSDRALAARSVGPDPRGGSSRLRP